MARKLRWSAIVVTILSVGCGPIIGVFLHAHDPVGKSVKRYTDRHVNVSLSQRQK